MSLFTHTFRHALRQLRRSPGFTAVAVLTLAIGIGSNTAIFSVVNTVLLHPLPYAQPERLVTVSHLYPSLDSLLPGAAVPTYYDLREESRVFDAVAVRSWWQPNLTGAGEPERLTGSLVSGDFFRTLGAEPLLGRTIQPLDVERGEKLAVLSHGLWTRRFGADPDVIGRFVELNGESHEVVGVMPRGFFEVTNIGAELWAPLAFHPSQMNARTNEFLTLVARLRPSLSLDAAQQELAAFAERMKEQNPGSYPADWTLATSSLPEYAVGSARPALLVLLGAVGLVLLIACANVANLLLARAAARRKEMAIRRALGAKAADLVRQLMGESLLLALVGGLLGLLLAFGATRLLIALEPGNLPRLDELSIDGTVLLFTLAIALVTALLFGLAPALHGTRTELQATLRQGGRSASSDAAGHRLRRGLIVTEVALALTLLMGAGLLIRSYAEIQRLDPGFDPEHLLTLNVALPSTKYATPEAAFAFFDELTSRIRALPGVRSVGASTAMPFTGGMSNRSFFVEGLELPPDQPNPWGQFRVVDADYFRTLGVPLRRGRYFEESDRMDAPPVAIVDEELANRYWPGDDPIGKRVSYERLVATGERVWIEVVGIVGHTAHSGLVEDRMVQLYRPYAQVGGPGLTIAVGTAADPERLVPPIREVVRSIDPDQPMAQVATMEDLVADSVGQRRFAMLLLGLFAAVALLLASIGIYGVISFDVARRRPEMGVRMALGAQPARVLRLVLGGGLRLTLIGVGFGALGALALARLISSQLYGVGRTDPVTFAAVATLLLAVAALATLLPAWRATRVDPTIALRSE